MIKEETDSVEEVSDWGSEDEFEIEEEWEEEEESLEET